MLLVVRRCAAFAALALAACADDAGLETVVAEDDALRVDGGDTGAFLREVTPAGHSCIMSAITLPDYREDVRTRGAPWVYFGFADDAGRDMEVGFAFQPGDGSPEKPRRWRPYMRRGARFWFAPESETVLPGGSTHLLARLSGDKVYVKKDGRPLSFVSGDGERIDFLRVEGLDRARAHVRRVVGQATSWRYGGGALGTLGPVVFDATRTCDRFGTEVPFRGAAASWTEVRGGVRRGTVAWPLWAPTRVRAGDRESVWLFR
jgi:hypothetical protein